MNSSLWRIIILLVVITQIPSDSAKGFWKVHVINRLPPNSGTSRVHCASGDDELGYRYLKVNEDFNWSFGKTLFFCHFWWKKNEYL
ncbi:hypothetical protein Leryth_023614 [Lithospermum erythrorhizon]|nr:hypothetical protein Leryth_023614 [Lithospermum erythrorhizon]